MLRWKQMKGMRDKSCVLISLKDSDRDLFRAGLDTLVYKTEVKKYSQNSKKIRRRSYHL